MIKINLNRESAGKVITAPPVSIFDREMEVKVSARKP